MYMLLEGICGLGEENQLGIFIVDCLAKSVYCLLVWMGSGCEADHNRYKGIVAYHE